MKISLATPLGEKSGNIPSGLNLGNLRKKLKKRESPKSLPDM